MDPSFSAHSDFGGDYSFSIDLDKDGDLDVLVAFFGGDKVSWFESDGASDPTFTENVLVSGSNANGAYQIQVA